MKCILSILLIVLCHTSVFGQYFTTLYEHPAQPGILKGETTTILVTGYSTSHQPKRSWPVVVQEMLNRHAGNESTYYVVTYTKSGSPIARWTDIRGSGRQETEFGSHVADAVHYYVNPGSRIETGMPKATVMLAQQSLQWVFGEDSDRFAGVEGSDDRKRIDRGAWAIMQYVTPLLDAGTKHIYMAMHIYKTGKYMLNLEGEKYALAKALNTGDRFHPGPELFDVSKSLWPGGFAEDQLHPGPRLANAMALYWYLVLAGEDAKPEIMAPVANAAGIKIPER